MGQYLFSLNGNDWGLLSDPGRLTHQEAAGMHDGWIPARVPGNVQWDLETVGQLRPLWYGDGDPALVDAARRDWWYKKIFTLPEEFLSDRQTLIFEGVDYSCDIYLNGTHVGRNEGMFKRFAFDVTSVIRKTGPNVLLVHIDRMPEELLEWIVDSDGPMSAEGTEHFFVFANNKIRQTLKGLKSPANCSYDWGTNIYTLGIWKDVCLHCTGGVRVEHLQIKASPDLQKKNASVRVFASVNSVSAASALLRIFCDGVQTAEVGAALNVGSTGVCVAFTLEDPALWWPVGYGEPALHTLRAELEVGGIISDSYTDTFGIRDIQWAHCEGVNEEFPNKFQLVLNGVPIRTMGSNFVVPDLLYARAKEKYAYFVKMAANCGMNTLRQHGGQVIFHKEFYNAADRLGVMLLVDFPIGNCVPENEPVFLQNFSETIRNIVQQLRNHPSIIEWSGGNELDWYFDPNADQTALQVQQEAVYAEDDTRVFRPTCPIAGSRHAPWDYQREVTYRQFNRDIKDNFGEVPMMRYGEFGAQTPANLETWYRDIPNAHQWPISEQSSVLARKNAVQAVGFGPNFWLCKDRIEALFGAADDLEMLLRAGQFVGAEGLRYMVDALRAKGKRVGGFTTWDYNEPWPNGAGSYVIDYDGRPVMSYYFMKQALAPLSLQLRYDDILYDFIGNTDAELLLVSDAPEAVSDLRWRYVARDRTGQIYDFGEGCTAIAPHEVVSLGKVRLNPPTLKMYGPSIVELTLCSAEGERLAERLYVFGAKGAMAPLRGIMTKTFATRDFGVPYVTTGMFGGEVSKTALLLECVQYSAGDNTERCEITLRNTGENTAFFTEIHPLTEYRTDLYIDNNFAFIPPKECRTITITAERNEKTPLRKLGFRVYCWNAEQTLTIAPCGVLARMSRKDGTTRGYAQPSTGAANEAHAEDGVFSQSKVPYLCTDTQQFTFASAHAGKLRICVHTADRDRAGKGMLAITLNGETKKQPLTAGRGLQSEDAEQYASPASFCFTMNGAAGNNTLAVQAQNGWFTWDSLTIEEVEEA